ncbi:MAG: PEPxxWA-CTERM sorting domain-containing protein [Syntrophales bacterium]
MKKLFMFLVFITALLVSANVFAYSDIYYSVGTPGTEAPTMELRVANYGSLKTVTFNAGQISSSSYSNPVVDPIVGNMSSIVTPYFEASSAFSYQLRNEIGTTGVWSLTDASGNPMNAAITAASTDNPYDPSRVVYFQAEVRAKTIDLINGNIAWEAVANPTFPNTLAGSETLAQLQYYVNNTILTNFSFVGSESLASWMRTTSKSGFESKSLDYSTNVTVVPEPAEWALMIIGLGMIGFSVYRKRYRMALPEWQNVRKS